MKKLVAATKNKGKLRELASMLESLPYTVLSLENWPFLAEPEETGRTFMENACLKAVYYAQKTGECCLADDSGLEVDALGGAPGVYSARYAGEHATDGENNLLLLRNMECEQERKCRFFCALALAAPSGEVLYTAEGACEGELLTKERGAGGFGYDPLFFSPELGRTLAEATEQEKNSLSHRSRALAVLVKNLEGGLTGAKEC